MFTCIHYFFQIYCGFSDIRLCKMPCREYCLRHLFFILFFLSCISFLSDFSSISSDIKLYSFQLFGSMSYWMSGRAGRAGRGNTWLDVRTEQHVVWLCGGTGRAGGENTSLDVRTEQHVGWLSGRTGRAGEENTWLDVRTEQHAVWVMPESKVFSLLTRPNSASIGIYYMTIVSSFSSLFLLVRSSQGRTALYGAAHAIAYAPHTGTQKRAEPHWSYNNITDVIMGSSYDGN